MTWIKLDDGFDEHLKIEALSDAGFRAFIEGLCYCSRALTDGHIPPGRVKKMWKAKVVAELLDAGVWMHSGDGVAVVGYLEHQRSKEQVEKERAAATARKKKSREGSHGESRCDTDGSSPEVRALEVEGERDTPTSRPVKPRLGSVDKRGKGGKPVDSFAVGKCQVCDDHGMVIHPGTDVAVPCDSCGVIRGGVAL